MERPKNGTIPFKKDILVESNDDVIELLFLNTVVSILPLILDKIVLSKTTNVVALIPPPGDVGGVPKDITDIWNHLVMSFKTLTSSVATPALPGESLL